MPFTSPASKPSCEVHEPDAAPEQEVAPPGVGLAPVAGRDGEASPIRMGLLAGLRITAAGTLASRLLGMVRDMATAALFGLGAGGVMDAFAVAFRIPNLFRRLFGEGALSAAFLPVFAAELEQQGERAAWRLASGLIGVLSAVLVVVVVLGEGACWLLWGGAESESARLVVGLTAVMLPYLVFMCLAAQVAAVLYSLGHFAAPALAPAALNVLWLVAVLMVAPWAAAERSTQAYVLAWFVLAAGPVQLGLQWLVLRRLGFRFVWRWTGSGAALRQIALATGPVILGLAITQLNTVADTLVAWLLARRPGGPESFALLGWTLPYPLEAGAAASIYYGDRVFQFPVGVFGVALGTVLYPLLSRHAARDESAELRRHLERALGMVLLIGVPAGVGLVVVAEPLTNLLFRRGAFSAEDAARTARMVAAYSMGVWAYCGLQVLVRTFYALGDRATPARTGAAVVGVNLLLNLTLIWPLAEAGLAVATSVCAMLQVAVLVWLVDRRLGRLDRRGLWRAAGQAVAASGAMAAGCVALRAVLPAGARLESQLVQVVVLVAVGAAIYAAVSQLLGARELIEIVRRRRA